MSSNEELSLSFYKCGMDVWSYKLEDKTYYLHVEDTSCPDCFKNLLNSYYVLMLQIQLKRNVTNAMSHLLLMVHYGIMFGYHTRRFSN